MSLEVVKVAIENGALNSLKEQSHLKKSLLYCS